MTIFEIHFKDEIAIFESRSQFPHCLLRITTWNSFCLNIFLEMAMATLRIQNDIDILNSKIVYMPSKIKKKVGKIKMTMVSLICH